MTLKGWKLERFLEPAVQLRSWEPWWAWKPVKDIHGTWHWLEMVYRKQGNTYVDHDNFSWYFYGTIFDLIKNE